MGGLVSKAGLEPLKSDALYGALLSLKNEFTKRSKEEVFELLDNWTLIGRKAFEAEKIQGTAISIKFKSMPPRKIIEILKENGLKWNAYRKEWEGAVSNIEVLKSRIKGSEYSIEILK